MRILVKPRKWIESRLEGDQLFCSKFDFISIFSSKDFSPLPDRPNILKLEFDDITDMDIPQKHADGSPLILFDAGLAGRIIRFIREIDRQKILVIHCDAGVSRSGAVGEQLNEYCNRIGGNDPRNYALFFEDNPGLSPNPLVSRVLREELERHPIFGDGADSKA